MLNLAMLLEDSARRFPTREAVASGEATLSYSELDAVANRVANLLTSVGVVRGDRVAISCPNTPHFLGIYYGILKAGGVVVPLNVLLKAREIAYHLGDSEAKAYFCFEGTPELPMADEGVAGFANAPDCTSMFVIGTSATFSHPAARDFGTAVAQQSDVFASIATDPDDTAVILYTSGTTGQPKGAELSHSNMVLNVIATQRLMGAPPVGRDTHLVVLPLFHSFGQTVAMNAALADGARLVLLPRFDPNVALEVMEAEEVTIFAGVPTMYWGLLNALKSRDRPVDVAAIASHLRIAVSGGAALPVEILSQFKEQFGVQILEGYGLSETSPVATFSDPTREPRPGSIGVPVWGVEVRLVNPDGTVIVDPGEDAVGEIAIRGHNVMKGYHNKPEATAAVMSDGWFRTGDLARRDDDGYYYIVDRTKDMIIRGGFNIYPREIEEVLMTHPEVSLAAVIGVPHASHGEEVKAVVIKAAGSAMTENDLVEWSKEKMAAYKYPRLVQYVAEMPMTATGKILKRELS